MRLTQTRYSLIAAVAAVVTVGAGDVASAYPQFQFSTDNAQCNLCHWTPSGGGLINSYGRDESADTISGRGDGGLLHGLWTPPELLSIGGDFRVASVLKTTADDPELLIFPMQSDLYLRLAIGNFSAYGTIGARSNGVRAEESRLKPATKDHYLMWQSDEKYVRAGRFFAPYGLRLQDHTSYTRRFQGLHTLEETYNLSGGLVQDEWEVHGTLFAPAPFQQVGLDAFGAALYYERRNEEQDGAFGVQTKAAIGSDTGRFWLGGLYKRWMADAKLLFLSQLDIGLQTFSEADADPQLQLLGHASLNYIRTSWVLSAALERYDADVLLEKSGRDAVGLTAQYFPLSHIELVLMGKLEFQGEDYGSPDPLVLFMFHYYL